VKPKLGPRTRRALFALTGAKRIFDDRPLHAQLVITYDCNLSCAYCTEYTPGAPLVPFDVLRGASTRSRRSARSPTTSSRRAVAAPDVVAIVRRLKQVRHGVNFVTLITNASS